MIRKLEEPILKREAIFLLIVGLLLGTVFVVGENYWNSSITRNEAIAIEATYDSYKVIMATRSPNIKEVIVRFSDLEQQLIDGACVDKNLLDNLDRIECGSKMQLLIHPNSNTIMELSANGEILVEFDTAQKGLHREKVGFEILGLILYTFAGLAAVKLIRKEVI